jgi:hypothetical protein
MVFNPWPKKGPSTSSPGLDYVKEKVRIESELFDHKGLKTGLAREKFL